MCVSVFSFVTSSFCLVLSVQISNLPSPACYEQSHRWTFVFVFCHRNCYFSLVSVFCLFKFQLFRLELVANGLTGELLYLCFCHRNCGFVYVFVLRLFKFKVSPSPACCEQSHWWTPPSTLSCPRQHPTCTGSCFTGFKSTSQQTKFLKTFTLCDLTPMFVICNSGTCCKLSQNILDTEKSC